MLSISILSLGNFLPGAVELMILRGHAIYLVQGAMAQKKQVLYCDALCVAPLGLLAL